MPATRPIHRLALAALACVAPAVATSPPPMSLDELARGYVELVLAIGEHDPSYVDAYYGPAERAGEGEGREARPRGTRAARGRALGDRRAPQRAAPRSGGPDAELLALRHDYLRHQLGAAAARIEMLRGRKLSFDEESRALYDAVAPRHDEALLPGEARRIAAVLDSLPPPPGASAPPAGASLRDRVEALRARVEIPRAKLAAVFARAIDECRKRSAAHVALPAGESFTVEEVTDKPWSGYNWYQGGYRSLIQVNVSLPIWIDRALDLACHEGYPGHHLYNALLERELVRGRGWPEFQVYPLFSPQSLIAEGTANYGVELAFPKAERLAFERDVLFPLAGLDPALAAPYAEMRELLEGLSYAGNEAARRYLDGAIDAAAAAKWLEHYTLTSTDRAAAAGEVLRHLPRVRHQLQPRAGPRSRPRRSARRRGGRRSVDTLGAQVEGVRRAHLLSAPAVGSGRREELAASSKPAPGRRQRGHARRAAPDSPIPIAPSQAADGPERSGVRVPGSLYGRAGKTAPSQFSRGVSPARTGRRPFVPAERRGLLVAQGFDRLEAGGAAGGPEAEEEADGGGEADGEERGAGRDGHLPAGGAAEDDRGAGAEGDAEGAPGQAERQRLDQELQQDVALARTEGLAERRSRASAR